MKLNTHKPRNRIRFSLFDTCEAAIAVTLGVTAVLTLVWIMEVIAT